MNGTDPTCRGRDAASRRRSLRIGLLAIVVAFIGFGSIHALQQPPFIAPDETAHVGYAQEVASGRLPEIDRFPPVPPEASQWQAERGSARGSAYLGVWVANHPPLFYVAVAPLIWTSRMFDAADGGLLQLRMANVLFAAVGVVLTYQLALEVTRRNGRLALFAAALAALVPHGHAVFSQGLNDGLGFAAGTAVVLAGVRCIRRAAAPARSDTLLLAAAAAVAFGARTSTMLLAVAVVGFVVAHRMTVPADDPAERARRAARLAVIGLAPGVVLFGWFYLRNVVLYGDIGASQYLLTMFRREDRGSVLEMMNQRSLWLRLHDWLLSASTRRRSAPPASDVLTAAAAVGVAIALATGRLRRHAGASDSPSARTELRWTLALCLVPLAVVAVTIAQHVSGGGNAHARYAMPAVGAAAVLAVIGLERLWSVWGPTVLITFAGWWAVVNVPVGVSPWATRGPRDDWGLPPRELRVLPLSDGWRDLAGALVAVGVTVASGALIALVRSRSHESPSGGDEETAEATPSTTSA